MIDRIRAWAQTSDGSDLVRLGCIILATVVVVAGVGWFLVRFGTKPNAAMVPVPSCRADHILVWTLVGHRNREVQKYEWACTPGYLP